MFLLVPAHPGCPGQSPESRKMVVEIADEHNVTIMAIKITIIIIIIITRH